MTTQETKTNIAYKVKDLMDGWTSLPHKTIEDGKTDLIRLRDRVGMVEWKSRPPHNYVLVEEQVVTTHTIIV
jgi:hypothetical protein